MTARQNRLRIFATVFIVLFGIYYLPIDKVGGMGPIKVGLMIASVFVLLFYTFKVSKAMVFGTIYILYQFFSASLHPETWRWSTLLFSVGLVYTYVCFYNLVYAEHVFTIDHFIRIVKGMMLAFFVLCIVQQVFITVGIRYFPLINLTYILNRGIGCNSFTIEPSMFARFMLVFYYAYVKCQEYKRGKGPFSLKELFSGEHRWVTVRFLWMMCTMGSGTAFVCLIAFSLYFVRWNNWFYLAPMLIAMYFALPALNITQLDRATSVINATATFEREHVTKVDGSAASRIAPILNSFDADFSKAETWFGKGVDNGISMSPYERTIFDDYGLIFYLIALSFNFACTYRFFSLSTLFMFMGLSGGAGSNTQYAWELMMVITCVRYFYENRGRLNNSEESNKNI